MTSHDFSRWYEAEWAKLYGRNLSGMENLIPYKQHKNAVRDAVEAGKPVPVEVLAEYPEMEA